MVEGYMTTTDKVLGYCGNGFKLVVDGDNVIVTNVHFKGFRTPFDIALTTGRIWRLSHKYYWDCNGNKHPTSSELKDMVIPEDVMKTMKEMLANL
jgi:hypothetical protein